MALFCSTFAYVLAKLAGDRWDAVKAAELANLDESKWSGFRTLGQLTKVADEWREPLTGIVGDTCVITKARSRAAGEFLSTKADVWISVDDDVYASAAVLSDLVHAVRATRGLVSVPCVVRGGGRCNFHKVYGPQQIAGIKLAASDQIGFGLFGVHRSAVETLAAMVAKVRVTQGPYLIEYPALFTEEIRDGAWIGEDVRFCWSCQAEDIPVMALCEAPTVHAGLKMKLSYPGLDIMVDERTAGALDDLDPTIDAPTDQ